MTETQYAAYLNNLSPEEYQLHLHQFDWLSVPNECKHKHTKVIDGISGDYDLGKGLEGVDITEIECLDCGITWWD